MKRAALHSLGCKVNSYETEAMRQMLSDAGYEIVPFEECADVYVINTCSVTNIADRKSRQMIRRARKKNPDAVVVAAGCYVQTSFEKAMEDTDIDILIGNNKKQDLLWLLAEYDRKGTVKGGLIDINAPDRPYEELKISRPKEHTRAFLKIQDGCNQFCSYCIIPYARGRTRSRRMEDVLAEAETLAQNGYQEIVLTGIHISSYHADPGYGLVDLIRQIHKVEGIRRIRLGSLEPGIVTEEFVSALAALPKVCPHFHLSLQSGCDAVLARMNRKYTTAEYMQKCRILRKYYEHPAITTDIIVGFPGETAQEFEQTYAFAKEAAFYEIHVFKYSRRDGTVAAAMPGQIPEQVKRERSARLLTLTACQREAFARWYEGKRVEVLFEEQVMAGKESYYEGFTPEYVKVMYKTDENVGNRIMEVEFFQNIY